jgi:hypothetical protein
MSGNIAEVISTKGKTKGGGWTDNQESMKIEATEEFKEGDSKSNSVGFR